MTFLFGDLLTLGWNEALDAGGAGGLCCWDGSGLILFLVTLHEDLAAAGRHARGARPLISC